MMTKINYGLFTACYLGLLLMSCSHCLRWRRQALGTGAHPPSSLHTHKNLLTDRTMTTTHSRGLLD